MMSSKKAKASTQNYNTGGLYGNASTGKTGTSYNPTSFETNLVNQTTSAIPEYLQQLVNPTYDSNIFKAQTAQRNRLANQSFENNLINPLASRGLTRGSSINQLSGKFAGKLADLETDAMANEDTRNADMLNNLFNYYQVPYANMAGISNLSGNLYRQALSSARQANQLSGNGLGSLANMLNGVSAGNSSNLNWGNLLGAGAGYYFGGPAGGQIGSLIGGQINGLF